MKHNWEFKKLSSLCDRIGDGLHGTPNYAEEGSYYFVNGNNLKNGFITVGSDTKRIDEEEFERLRVDLSEATLLLSINGTIGEMALYRGEPIALGKSAAYINCRDIDRRFCYYYFQLKGVVQAFYNIATGSTIKNLGLESLKEFLVPVPPKDSQEQIAKVLSTLDAKIELNNRINEELEGLAKLLYDYWFGQFDFPISAAQAAAMGDPALEGKPYRQSGGNMVYNPTLKREIPEGWDGGSILDVAELGGGGTPSKEEPSWWNGNIPFFTPTDTTGEIFCLTTEDKITTDGLEKSAAKLYPAGTLFITARGSVGRVVITDCDSSMSQSCYALQPNPGVSSGFLYFHIHALMGYLKAKSSGSVFKSIVTNDLKFSPSTVPSTDVLKAYHEQTDATFSQILTLQKQNQHLTELRDWLLPMLMNGQVTVGQ